MCSLQHSSSLLHCLHFITLLKCWQYPGKDWAHPHHAVTSTSLSCHAAELCFLFLLQLSVSVTGKQDQGSKPCPVLCFSQHVGPCTWLQPESTQIRKLNRCLHTPAPSHVWAPNQICSARFPHPPPNETILASTDHFPH